MMFPEKKNAILRLSLKDPLFRSVIEDLNEAHESLARLVARSGSVERPEIAEYQVIIHELEAEVRAYVASKCA